jgi:hypothetical protein
MVGRKKQWRRVETGQTIDGRGDLVDVGQEMRLELVETDEAWVAMRQAGSWVCVCVYVSGSLVFGLLRGGADDECSK